MSPRAASSGPIESINRNIEDSDQISEELRIAFNAMDGKLDGIAGLYYLQEQINRNEMLDQRFPSPASTGKAAFPQDVESYSTAVFGEVGYHLLDTLKLIAGARMTWESKDVDLAGILVAGPGLPPPLSVPYNISRSENWDAFTPRFVVEWTVTDEAMVYASAARGFKSGGYQGTAGTAASAATAYDPEYAWSYELGAKTQWFENKLRVNAEFAGSTEGAHRWATLLGVAITAKRLGVDVLAYLTWAIERLGTWKKVFNMRAADLTPEAYKRACETAKPS